MTTTYHHIPYDSELYHKTLKLRQDVLRTPLGLTLTEKDVAQDAVQEHFCALQEGKLTGCVILHLNRETGSAKLRQMAVTPAAQSGGVGTRLLAFIEDWAKQQEITQITLHARVEASRFYEKAGYEREGGSFEEVTIPHIKMRKLL